MAKKSSEYKKCPVNAGKIRMWVAKQNEIKKHLCKRMKISWTYMYKVERGHRSSLRMANKFSEYTGNAVTLEDMGWKIERKENI